MIPVSIASSGLREDTDQSLPPDTTAPVRTTLAIGYCHLDRAGPSAGSASLVRYSSPLDHSGSKLATTPRTRKRGMSAGSMSCRWAMLGLASRSPLTVRAYARASSDILTARSPIAWMWIWKPARSSAPAIRSSVAWSRTGVPASPRRSR